MQMGKTDVVGEGCRVFIYPVSQYIELLQPACVLKRDECTNKDIVTGRC